MKKNWWLRAIKIWWHGRGKNLGKTNDVIYGSALRNFKGAHCAHSFCLFFWHIMYGGYKDLFSPAFSQSTYQKSIHTLLFLLLIQPYSLEPTFLFWVENEGAQHFQIWVIFWILICKLSWVLRGEIDVSLKNNFWLIEYFELLVTNIAKMMKNHFCMYLCSNLTHCAVELKKLYIKKNPAQFQIKNWIAKLLDSSWKLFSSACLSSGNFRSKLPLKVVEVVILSEISCHFISCSACKNRVFFSNWDKSGVKWANSPNPTEM